MTTEEKRQRIINAHREKQHKYSEEEISRAILRTAGALSALKSEDIDALKAEAILCR